MIHAPDARRWVLAREESARRLAAAGNTPHPQRAARLLRRLDIEAARASNRGLIALRAADDLLDTAAAECFAEPLAATDVVRWNHLRRAAAETERELARGADGFGRLRLQTDAPTVWQALAEPKHTCVPAWTRFEEAVRLWSDVQNGKPWIPPDRFPPPAGPPAMRPTPVEVLDAPIPDVRGASGAPAAPRKPAGPGRPPDRGRAR